MDVILFSVYFVAHFMCIILLIYYFLEGRVGWQYKRDKLEHPNRTIVRGIVNVLLFCVLSPVAFIFVPAFTFAEWYIEQHAEYMQQRGRK